MRVRVSLDALGQLALNTGDVLPTPHAGQLRSRARAYWHASCLGRASGLRTRFIREHQSVRFRPEVLLSQLVDSSGRFPKPARGGSIPSWEASEDHESEAQGRASGR